MVKLYTLCQQAVHARTVKIRISSSELGAMYHLGSYLGWIVLVEEGRQFVLSGLLRLLLQRFVSLGMKRCVITVSLHITTWLKHGEPKIQINMCNTVENFQTNSKHIL